MSMHDSIKETPRRNEIKSRNDADLVADPLLEEYVHDNRRNQPSSNSSNTNTSNPSFIDLDPMHIQRDPPSQDSPRGGGDQARSRGGDQAGPRDREDRREQETRDALMPATVQGEQQDRIHHCGIDAENLKESEVGLDMQATRYII